MEEKNQTPESPENSGGAGPPEENLEAEEQGEVTKEARMWAMFCHLAGLAWLLWWVVPMIGGVIAPLIVWQLKKDEHSFIDEHGKEALNFQISMLIYGVIAGLLCFACIGFVLLPAVMVADIVFSIIASTKGSGGRSYKYPLTIRFVK